MLGKDSERCFAQTHMGDEPTSTHLNFYYCVQLAVSSLPKNLDCKCHNNWKNIDLISALPPSSFTYSLVKILSQLTDQYRLVSMHAAAESPNGYVIAQAILGHQTDRLFQSLHIKLL